MKKNYLGSIYRDTGVPPGTFLLFTFILSFIFNLSHIPKYFSLNKFSDLFIVSFSCLSVITMHWLCVMTKRKKMTGVGVIVTLVAGFGVFLLVKEECGTADRWLLALLLFVGSIFSGLYTVFMKIFMEIRPYRNNRSERERNGTDGLDKECCIDHALIMKNLEKDQHYEGDKRTHGGREKRDTHIYDRGSVKLLCRLKDKNGFLTTSQGSSIDAVLQIQNGTTGEVNGSSNAEGNDDEKRKCGDSEKREESEKRENSEKRVESEGMCKKCADRLHREEKRKSAGCQAKDNCAANTIYGDVEAVDFKFHLNNEHKIRNVTDHEVLAGRENVRDGSEDNTMNGDQRHKFDLVEIHRHNEGEIGNIRPFKQPTAPGRFSATSNYMQTFIQSFVHKINKKNVTEQQLSDLSFMRHYLGTTGILTLLLYWPMIIIPLDALQPTFGVHGSRLLIHVVISNILSISQNILYFVLVTCRSPHFVQLSGMILQPTIICVEMLMVMTCFTKRLVGFGCIFGSLFFIR